MEQTGLPEGTIRGICGTLAQTDNTDTHATALSLCETWGVGWQQMEALAQMSRKDLEAVTGGLATRGAAIAGIAQSLLMEKLSDPMVTAGMSPKDLSTISVQQANLAMAHGKQPPIMQVNNFNYNPGDIEALKQMRQRQVFAKERLERRGVVIDTEAES